MKLLTIAAMLLASCDGRTEEAARPEPPRPEPEVVAQPEPPPAEVAPREGACEADAPNVLVAPAPEVPAVAIAPGLVVYPEDATTLVAQPIDGRAGPVGEPSRLAIPNARGLFALRAVSDRFVVLTEGECAATRCLAARLLGDGGRPRGDVVRATIPGPLVTRRVRTTTNALLLARSHAGAAPALDRFEVAGETIRHRAIELGRAHPPGDRRVEILGLTADGERWAVAWRAGAAEAQDSEVVVTTHERERSIEALHHALLLESFAWRGDALVGIAAFEMSRPRLVRLTARGESSEPVAPGALPAPFAGETHASLHQRDHRLSLELRSAAGDRIGEVRLAAILDRVVADVARVADGFVVAYAGPEANGRVVNASHVRCDD